MLSSTTFVYPAYGRIYKSNKEAVKAWKNGADFRISGSRTYCSIRDFTILDPICIVLDGEKSIAVYTTGGK